MSERVECTCAEEWNAPSANHADDCPYFTGEGSEARMSELIGPRTTGERRAFISGYVAAVNDAEGLGVDFAASQVRLLVESENHIAERKGEEPPYPNAVSSTQSNPDQTA